MNTEAELELTRRLFSNELNRISEERAEGYLLADTVVRRHPSRDAWVVVNKKEAGFSSFGIEFDSLIEVAETFLVRFGCLKNDEHSDYIALTALPRSSR